MGTQMIDMRIRAAGLIFIDDALLMVEHEKENKTYWLLPGGGINLGEDIKRALKRELKEEINLDCTVKDLLFVVESICSGAYHIIQPTYYIEVKNYNSLKLGVDKRVAGFGVFNADALESIIIHPDIKNELKEYLKNKKCSKKYINKKWID